MNLKFITVNFGNTTATRNLVNSILSSSLEGNFSLTIIDNKSSSRSKKELLSLKKQSKIDIEILINEKNLYYWPAVNKIISDLKDSESEFPDWILICNNDIIINDKYFLKKLEKINPIKNPIIGPDITNTSGDHLNPFMAKPLSRLGHIYWWLYFISYPTSRVLLFLRRFLQFFYTKKKNIEQLSKIVYSVHGSAILLSSYFFKSGGWLDDNFELYGEELTLAEIAKKINIPITYYPILKIVHSEHTNTKKINNKLLFKKARESHQYITNNYM
jgi:GT2 family glycosyltransferase